MNENKILFTIGRMNPPTTGHMLLIQSMMDQAIRLNLTQIFIILSATVDDKKNPFECEEKRSYLYGKSGFGEKVHGIIDTIKDRLKREHSLDSVYQNKVNALKVEIICMDDPTLPEYGTNPIMKSILSILASYKEKENLQMILMIGQDRATDFQWIGNTLASFQPPIQFNVLPISRPAGAVSATLIRQLALSNNEKEFLKQMEPLGLPKEELEEIYKDIQERIKIKGGKKKKRKKQTQKKMRKAQKVKKIRKIKSRKAYKNKKGSNKSNLGIKYLSI